MANRPSVAFASHPTAVRRIVLAHRALNPRVLGSAARGEHAAARELDLLADAQGTTSLFDLAAIDLELEALLGCPVHVMANGALKGALRARVLADAEPV